MWLAYQRQWRHKYLKIFLLLILSSQISVSLGFLLPDSFRASAFQVHLDRYSIRRNSAARWHGVTKRNLLSENSMRGEAWNVTTIDNVERIFAISDLHTDNVSNLEWLKILCTNVKNDIGKNDALIIAGDISHELSKLRETLSIIKQNLNCQIFFVWGNHEAWIGGQEMDSLGIETSFQKIAMVKQLCREMGVHTECKLVGTSNDNPAFILPIESWYDASLSLRKCEDLCSDFHTWRWVDFIRCVWPDEEMLPFYDDAVSATKRFDVLQNIGQIPLGLTQALEDENEKSIKDVQDEFMSFLKANITQKNCNDTKRTLPGLITFSHFLPNRMCLPDWKDPESDAFLRDEWLDHPVPGTSAKFAKVAGSILIDEQIRRIVPKDMKKLQPVQHLHVFGHSHRPKDFVYNNIRYVHNPLGKPAEREMNMVSQDVGFQLIWDCTTQSSARRNAILEKSNHGDNFTISAVGIKAGTLGGGEIPGRQVIRYWEEQGGGKEVLARNMRNARRKRRIQMKRSLRALELSKKTINTSKSKE